MMTKGNLTLTGRHTMQYSDNISCICILETYMLLTNITWINLVKIYLRNKEDIKWGNDNGIRDECRIKRDI